MEHIPTMKEINHMHGWKDEVLIYAERKSLYIYMYIYISTQMLILLQPNLVHTLNVR